MYVNTATVELTTDLMVAAILPGAHGWNEDVAERRY